MNSAFVAVVLLRLQGSAADTRVVVSIRPWWSHVDGGWMLMYTLQEHQMVKISRGLYYKVPHIHIVF